MTRLKHTFQLPQLNGQQMLTDSGLETTLIFHDGMDIPHFASFVFLREENGRERLKDYYRTHARIAQDMGVGFVFDTPTWRASADWGDLLDYDTADLDALNQEAITFLRGVEAEFKGQLPASVVSGNIGPRGDGYNPEFLMSVEQARDYHLPQVHSFAAAGADMITVMTLSYVEEAIGLALAAKATGIPIVLSFTVETDGKLATGQELGDAIMQVDRETDFAPAYFMINCAHPTHFADMIPASAPWIDRVMAIRANASCMSHAELDNAEELDDGNPVQLGQEHRDLLDLLPNLRVFGGCCGTDHRHVTEIGKACLTKAA